MYLICHNYLKNVFFCFLNFILHKYVYSYRIRKILLPNVPHCNHLNDNINVAHKKTYFCIIRYRTPFLNYIEDRFHTIDATIKLVTSMSRCTHFCFSTLTCQVNYTPKSGYRFSEFKVI